MGSVSPAQVSDGSTMDASDINNPINTIANEFNGNIDNTNIKAAAAITGSKLADNSIDITTKASSWDGWVQVTDTWTYASATTVTVPSDATTKYSVGDKVKFTNSGSKYFYITAVSATVLTLNGGSDYTVANAAISAVYYSKAETPQSFPAYFNFTPSWTNLTVGTGGSATNVGRFSMCGKTVWGYFRTILGTSGQSMGSNPYFATPVDMSTSYSQSTHNTLFGNLNTGLNGGANIPGWTGTNTASNNSIKIYVSDNTTAYGQLSGITSTIPVTYAATSYVIGSFQYEAA